MMTLEKHGYAVLHDSHEVISSRLNLNRISELFQSKCQESVMWRVEDSELDSEDGYFWEYQGQPFTGICYEHGPEKMYTEMEYKDGVQHGITREWSREGRLIVEAHYACSIRISEKKWNDDGELIYEYHISPGEWGWRHYQDCLREPQDKQG